MARAKLTALTFSTKVTPYTPLVDLQGKTGSLSGYRNKIVIIVL